MKSYSETSNLFTGEELRLLRRATRLVEGLDVRPGDVRCHELARAVGRVMALTFQDGSYGFVEHTWLWTTPLPDEATEEAVARGFPNILDVCCVGQLPMVRLAACGSSGFPHVGWIYRPGRVRLDVNHAVVEHLVTAMYRKYPAGTQPD